MVFFSAVLATIFEQRTCFGANEPHSNMLCARPSYNVRHNPVSFSLFLVLIYDYLFLNTASYCCNQTSAVLHKRASQASKMPICILSLATKCRPSSFIHDTASLLQEQDTPCIIALGSVLCAQVFIFSSPHLKPAVSLLIAHEICFLCSILALCWQLSLPTGWYVIYFLACCCLLLSVRDP